MMTAGMLLFTKISASGSPIVYIVIPGILTAAGIGMSIVPSTIIATQGAKQGQAGLASGLVNTSRQIGGGLGIAVLITLATSRTSHLIGGGTDVDQALTEGFRLGYYIAAGLCAAAAVANFAWVAKAPVTDEVRPSVRRFGALIAVTSVIVVFVAVDFAAGGSHGAPIGAYTTNGAYTFVSDPSLHPPVVTSDTAAGDAEARLGLHLPRQLL